MRIELAGKVQVEGRREQPTRQGLTTPQTIAS